MSETGPHRGTGAESDPRPDAADDCREVLEEVYLYLDLECTDHRRDTIRQHLDECRPCLREYGIEQEVKQLVNRCCGEENAPAELRDRLRRKLSDLVTPTHHSQSHPQR